MKKQLKNNAELIVDFFERNDKSIIAETIHALIKEIERLEKSKLSEGWIRAIQEALLLDHIGVLNPEASYEEARQQLNLLLCVNQDTGTSFAVQEIMQCLDTLWDKNGR